MDTKGIEIIKNRIMWQAYDKNINEINEYKIKLDCFLFKFKIEEKNKQRKFADLIKKESQLSSLNILDFLIRNKIEYKMELKYVKNIGLFKNIQLFIAFCIYKLKLTKIYLSRYFKIREET